MELIIMIVGFMIASYSIIANDSIQTLGTFLASNAKRPWWLLSLFATSILVITCVVSWYTHGGDASWELLDRFPQDLAIRWYHLAGPIALLILTRAGYPVSTTMLILNIFAQQADQGLSEITIPMVQKSMVAYGVAFGAGLLVFATVMNTLERRWASEPNAFQPTWVVLQWFSTAFLWFTWLSQDLANIFIYLPRPLPLPAFILALSWMVAVMAYIFYSHGGKIQRVVLEKTNTTDIRSATIIDLIYGTVLFTFKSDAIMQYIGFAALPMSTTWTFIGLLAGREFGLRLRNRPRTPGTAFYLAAKDLAKAFTGLVVSLVIAFLLPWLHQTFTHEPVEELTAPAAVTENVDDQVDPHDDAEEIAPVAE